MKQLVFTFLFALLAIQFSLADPVNANRALTVAKNHYHHFMPATGGHIPAASLVYTRTEGNTPVYYVFDFGTDSGFVIIAADDDVYPVPGYSFEKNYAGGMAQQPPSFTAWMDNIANQILYTRDQGLKGDETIKKQWSDLESGVPMGKGTENVDPLITTNWNQDQYYNALCPSDPQGPGGHCYAGCVATTMGQIMKYYNHPVQGEGSHSYYLYPYGTLSADFGATTYNWASMPSQIYSNNIHVATLLYHLGVSVDMQYGPNGSGAYSADARDAFVNYFSYSDEAQYIAKSSYSTTAWENILKDELEASRPVYYAGSGPDGGHAFVCDGYQGTNYFHFNWGWSGWYNGYFYLNNLNPGGSQFNQDQRAIVNIYPEQSGTLDPPVNLQGSIENNDVTLTWEAPSGGTGEWIQWDAGMNNGNGIGLTNGGTFSCASHWAPADLTDYDGLLLKEIKFFPNGDDAAGFTIKVWTGAGGTTMVLNQSVTNFIVDEWNTVVLNNPVTIDASVDLWFGYEVTHGAGTFPAGCDDGPAIQNKGDMISLGSGWVSMSSQYGLDYNWNIAGYVVSEDDQEENPQIMVEKINQVTSVPSFVNSSKTASPKWMNKVSKDLLGYNVYRNTVQIGYTTETTYIDEDIAPGTHEYYVTALYDEGESEPSNYVYIVGPPNLPPPYNLTGPTAVLVNEPFELCWEMQYNGGWIQWDAGINTGNGIGLTNGGSFSVASHWLPSDLTGFDGYYLEKVSFFANADPDATYIIKVWTGANGSTTVASQAVTGFTVDEWNEIELTSPVMIDATTDLWFGYTVTHDAGTFPAGCDDGPAVPNKGDMISLGSGWESMSINYSLDYNWNIAGWVSEFDGEYLPLIPSAQIESGTASDNSISAKGSGTGFKTMKGNESKDLLGFNIYRNGSLIGNTIENCFEDIITTAGNFEYYVTALYDEGESVPSNPWYVSIITGVSENNTNKVTVYPCPASTQISITSHDPVGRVMVLDITGSVAASIDRSGTNSVMIDVSRFEPGMYFLQVETSSGNSIHRLIIE